MREVKFRAWHKEKKMLVKVLDLYLSDGTVQLPIETEVADEYWWYSTTWDLKDVELMQYTGLKDEDGTEIYEGDIVKCFANGNSYVSFKGGVYGLIFDYTFIPFSDIHGGMQVIGNVFQNGGLLNDS